MAIPCHWPLPSFRQLPIPSSHSTVTFSSTALPGAFCSLPQNGNFSPLRNSEYWTKWPCKGAISGEHCWWITAVRPGWNRFSLVTKQKRALPPHPEASPSSPSTLSTGSACSWSCSDGAAHVANYPKKHLLQNLLCYHHIGNITCFGWRPPCGGAAGGSSFICTLSLLFHIILKV